MGAKGGGVAFEHKNGARDRDERAMAALVDVGASVSRFIFSPDERS